MATGFDAGFADGSALHHADLLGRLAHDLVKSAQRATHDGRMGNLPGGQPGTMIPDAHEVREAMLEPELRARTRAHLGPPSFRGFSPEAMAPDVVQSPAPWGLPGAEEMPRPDVPMTGPSLEELRRPEVAAVRTMEQSFGSGTIRLPDPTWSPRPVGIPTPAAMPGLVPDQMSGFAPHPPTGLAPE